MSSLFFMNASKATCNRQPESYWQFQPMGEVSEAKYEPMSIQYWQEVCPCIREAGGSRVTHVAVHTLSIILLILLSECLITARLIGRRFLGAWGRELKSKGPVSDALHFYPGLSPGNSDEKSQCDATDWMISRKWYEFNLEFFFLIIFI